MADKFRYHRAQRVGIKALDGQELMNALIVTIRNAIGILAARYEGMTPPVLLGIKPAPFFCR